MIQRAALLLASLVAALSLAVGLAAAGLAPRPAPVGTGATAPAVEAPDLTAAPKVQTDTVYLPAPVEPQDVTVHRVVQAGGHGDEHEGGEDD